MSLTPRSLLITILVLIVGVIFSASPPVLLGKEKMSTPDDFEIYLQSAGRVPMSAEYALLIGPNGHCKYFETPQGQDTGFVLISELDLDAKAMEKIYETVKKEKFFELKKEYRDPEVMDGDFAEMEITADGKTHTVKTINIKVDAFDNIVREIDALLPKEMRISYNALHVDSYKRVKR